MIQKYLINNKCISNKIIVYQNMYFVKHLNKILIVKIPKNKK